MRGVVERWYERGYGMRGVLERWYERGCREMV